MIDLSQRIAALDQLGNWLTEVLEDPSHPKRTELDQKISLAFHKNGWFTEAEVKHALGYWGKHLQRLLIETWLSEYPIQPKSSRRVMLILAGNIPMVGMHDVVSTLLSGNKALIKCSSSDAILLPYLMEQLITLQPKLAEDIQMIEGIEKTFDAVLATGSNNSSRYFETYFSHVPRVIRRNRTGVALLDGTESKEDLNGLMADAFTYYGLGCRNVTKLYLPEGYDLNQIFEASLAFEHLMSNKKYVNNYTYHKAIMMLERQPFLENDLVVMREDPSLFSPVSVLHYSFYTSQEAAQKEITSNFDAIQCVIGKQHIPFGFAQKPGLKDYADGVDTLDFLLDL